MEMMMILFSSFSSSSVFFGGKSISLLFSVVRYWLCSDMTGKLLGWEKDWGHLN